MGDGQRIFCHVELVAQGDPHVAVERPLAPGLDLGELEISRGEAAVGVRLMELRSVVAVVDAREQVALFEVFFISSIGSSTISPRICALIVMYSSRVMT